MNEPNKRSVMSSARTQWLSMAFCSPNLCIDYLTIKQRFGCGKLNQFIRKYGNKKVLTN